ncbi:inhibitor of nuclear factor kappa-B kinase-interacting protein isoform X1 [Eublepharis macularius]|uniref:Inhibitor of nuclear factor kappa-B kinase-interacting protein isoform X1 n=1 Tax=Eublepharis macularius TaxID=481883 RepID=A0AA97L6V0_EUBMA|nr:inhibitor of nuclear factor kappa-B kinase-interacting protein isoform X1 [Eublepharis macularius]
MSEIKQRRKTNTSAKLNEEQQKLDEQLGAGSTSGLRSLWMDPRTAASCLSLTVCVGLTWFLFQQSAQLIAVQEKFHLLKEEAVKFQDIETKIEQMSTKLESSLSVLQKASSSISVMTKLQQEVASLHNIIPDIQNSEQTLSEKVQSVNEKFQCVIASWKRSQEEMDTNASSLKLEAKILHNEVTSQINAADSGIKSLSERLKDLEDSTVRNIKTLNRQEEADLSKIEQRLQADTESAQEVEEKQNNLLVRNNDLRQKLADREPKEEECKSHLPIIENAIHSVVRLSSNLIGIEKEVKDMAVKVFNSEGEMVKATFEIMNIQKALEGIKKSRLTLQKEVPVLKIHDFTQSTAEIIKEHLENHPPVNDTA